jgi:acetyl esterase/lipase
VIGIHGGFWRAKHELDNYGHLCDALAKAGVATWNIEYRRIGNEGRGWPGTFHDVAHAADFVREIATTYNLGLSRVVTLGHSAGGHLAFWLAARHRLMTGDPLSSPDSILLKASVSLAGVVDLRRPWELRLGDDATELLLGGTPSAVPERYRAASPFELLPSGIEQVLVHGTADPNVPSEISARYAAAARDLGDHVSLISLPDAEHMECVNPYTREGTTVVEAVMGLI